MTVEGVAVTVVPTPDRRRRWLGVVGVTLAGYLAMTAFLFAMGSLIVAFGDDIGLEAFDDNATEWLADRRSKVATGLSGVFTAWADTWTIVGGLIAAVCALLPTRAYRRATTLVVAQLLEISVFLSVTYAVGRPRPLTQAERLSSTPSTGSFPSGHIAASVVLYGGLALIAWSLIGTRWIRNTFMIVGAVIVPLAVGWSRFYRGLHHPSDLLAGAALGAACLYVGVLASRWLPPDRGTEPS